MRKRVRKKKNLKEFKEFGCEIKIELDPATDFNEFLDDYIYNVIEKNGMRFGGGCTVEDFDGYVELGKRDIYQENINVLEQWLANHPSVIKWVLSLPEDARYQK